MPLIDNESHQEAEMSATVPTWALYPRAHRGTDVRYILGYFDIRGLGDPVRLMFYYHNVQFAERRYVYKSNPEWERDRFVTM